MRVQIQCSFYLFDVRQGGLGLERGQHRAVQNIEMVVLKVCADAQAPLAHERAHGQLDMAPGLWRWSEEHQPPFLPIKPWKALCQLIKGWTCVQTIDMAVLQVCENAEAALTKKCAHGQLDMAPCLW